MLVQRIGMLSTRRRHLTVLALLTLVAAFMPATERDPAPDDDHDSLFAGMMTVSQTVTTEGYVPQYQQLALTGLIEVRPFSLVGELRVQNDDRYSPPQDGHWYGYHATIHQGGAILQTGPFTVRAGKLLHSGQVDSPYSLFVSSQQLSALQLDLRVETSRLFFTTRSIMLNRDSARGYPERGAAIRSWGVRLGNLRLGFQDSIVYTGRTFDLEYFINPVPGGLIQYVNRARGSPWAMGVNHNSLMGFFADYSLPRTYLYAQVLVDDFNSNRFVDPDSYQNPDKIAWSLGARHGFHFGHLGFYHAGATKYTFQSFGSPGIDTRYSYTYYPDVEYRLHDEVRVIRPEDNYIGYLHGENNLAFLLSYDPPDAWLGRLTLTSSLELTLSGSKSPGNPWHQYTWWTQGGQGTRFLDDERLELRLLGRAAASLPVRGWTFSADISLGFVRNELELTAIPDEYFVEGVNEIRYFSPGTVSRPIGSLGIGASYGFGYGRRNARADW